MTKKEYNELTLTEKADYIAEKTIENYNFNNKSPEQIISEFIYNFDLFDVLEEDDDIFDDNEDF